MCSFANAAFHLLLPSQYHTFNTIYYYCFMFVWNHGSEWNKFMHLLNCIICINALFILVAQSQASISYLLCCSLNAVLNWVTELMLLAHIICLCLCFYVCIYVVMRIANWKWFVEYILEACRLLFIFKFFLYSPILIINNVLNISYII